MEGNFATGVALQRLPEELDHGTLLERGRYRTQPWSVIYEDGTSVKEKINPKSVPTAPIQIFWDTLLLCQVEDRAPLESDPSADLEAGMRWGVHKSPYPSEMSKTNSSWQ